MSPIPVKKFGPTTKGVVDAANSVLELDGTVRYARNAVLDGAYRLLARQGTEVAMVFNDDAISPAECTSVVAVAAFGDGCLVVAHSTATQKFYLYWLDDQISGWYNASKVLTAGSPATPVGVLWTAAATPAQVTIAEGLGVAYIAHSNAGSSFKTQKFDTSVSPAVLSAFQANLDGTGAKDTFFRGVVSFQQHLWGWGYGSQAAGDNDRPELLRFSTPFFGAMAAADNFAVGHRVRSQRERVVEAIVAGEVLYVGTNFQVWPVTGFGRNSWDKSRPADDSYGFSAIGSQIAGPNGWLYYWSHRGLLRIRGLGPPEPLWPSIVNMARSVVNDTLIRLAYDYQTDQVLVIYNNGGAGNSVLLAYDTIHQCFLGPDGDVGLGVACVGNVQPVVTPPPAGPPTTPSTNLVGRSVATAHWVNGDTGIGTTEQIEYRVQGTTPWTVASSSLGAGVTSYRFTGLQPSTAYEWRIKHVRGGQSSTYLGPVAGTQFTTGVNPLVPTNVAIALQQFFISGNPVYLDSVSWTDTGENAYTEIDFTGPLGAPPASGTIPVQATANPGATSGGGTFAGTNGTYYAEVRAYVTDGGGTHYSGYSGVVSKAWP